MISFNKETYISNHLAGFSSQSEKLELITRYGKPFTGTLYRSQEVKHRTTESGYCWSLSREYPDRYTSQYEGRRTINKYFDGVPAYIISAQDYDRLSRLDGIDYSYEQEVII